MKQQRNVVNSTCKTRKIRKNNNHFSVAFWTKCTKAGHCKQLNDMCSKCVLFWLNTFTSDSERVTLYRKGKINMFYMWKTIYDIRLIFFTNYSLLRLGSILNSLIRKRIVLHKNYERKIMTQKNGFCTNCTFANKNIYKNWKNNSHFLSDEMFILIVI